MGVAIHTKAKKYNETQTIKKKKPCWGGGEVLGCFEDVGFFGGFHLGFGLGVFFCATGRQRGALGCISAAALVRGVYPFLLFEERRQMLLLSSNGIALLS